MRVGVDFSEWGGALSPQVVNCWKQQGVTFAVVQYSHRMPQHLTVLKDAGGLYVEAYVYLYWGLSPWGQTPADRVRAAIAMIQGFPVRRLWLDAEDTTSPYREDQLAECEAVCAQAGIPTGIYTGRWWWEPRTRNSHRFSHLPLWHAEYLLTKPEADATAGAGVPFDLFMPYGGWTRPTIWQYQGTSTLCGHSVDMNATEEASPRPSPRVWPIEDELKTLVDVGHFLTQGYDLRDITPWQVQITEDLLRRMKEPK